MASRRELKKSVNYISGELFAECLVNAMFIPGTDKAKAEDIMAEILKMQDEFQGPFSQAWALSGAPPGPCGFVLL